MDVREITAPTTEPVTLTEAKLWCRIEDDDTSQDAVLLLLIRAARERAEHLTGRKYSRRQVELRLDSFPSGPIDLPYPPLVSVDSFLYGTADGDVELTGSPETYQLDEGGDQTPARVAPLTTWPTAATEIAAIRIRYTVGYASTSKMPAALRLWMQQRISTWYENREHMGLSNVTAFPRDFVDGLLDGLRAARMFG